MIRRFLKWFVLLAAVGVLAGVIILNSHLIQTHANRPMPAKTAETKDPDITVVTVQEAGYEARITGYGAAEPHFELTLTAEVSGQVKTLSPDFEAGQRIHQGELLVELEDNDYRATVASAKNDLATARLNLLEEKRQGLQAQAEWNSSGMKGPPDSELVLRKPQMEAAMAALFNAEAALASAGKDLDRTRITAPFDGVMVERQIAPGSYVQAGTAMATVFSTDRMEIRISLSARDWQNLPDTAILRSGKWPVALTGVENGQTWSGRILRTEKHLDDTTRQRVLIVAVNRPLDLDPPLLAGTFVKADIRGRRVEHLWKLPSASLSQRGEIWYVKADNTLDKFSAQPAFSDAEAIYLPAPKTLAKTPRKILVHPLSSYIRGMAVHPVEESGNEE